MVTPNDYLNQAQKCLSASILNRLFKGGIQYDEAADNFKLAGNQFKVENDWLNAENAYLKAADCYKKSNDDFQAASMFIESAEVRLKWNHQEIPEALHKGCDMYNVLGRFFTAGRVWKNIGETFLELHEEDKAIKCFKMAAESFKLDNYSKSAYTTAISKYAELIAKENKIDEAIEIFETEAVKATKNSLSNFSAKNYFFNASLLLLSLGDAVTSTEKIKHYLSLDSKFADSREGIFVNNLADAFENNNYDLYCEHIDNFMKVSSLDDWRVFFLAKSKKQLMEQCGIFDQNSEDSNMLDLS